MTARIAIHKELRARLKRFGHPGMTYAEILRALMDRVEREDFLREIESEYKATPRKAYVRLEDL